MKPCAYCHSGAPAPELLFHMSNYEGRPIKIIHQCTSCASWSLKNRPDIYSVTYEEARINQVTWMLQ